jgi:hypothetical protein
MIIVLWASSNVEERRVCVELGTVHYRSVEKSILRGIKGMKWILV